jgi:hypothetical protein
MSTKTVIASALLATLAAVAIPAMATDNPRTAQDNAASTTGRPLTRAEVLADLQIYRESGLAQVNLPENFGYDQKRRAEAEAKYAQLRQSAYYASLVKRYGGSETDTDVAAAR